MKFLLYMVSWCSLVSKIMTSGSDKYLAESLAQVIVNSEMGRLKTLYIYTHISSQSTGGHLEELLDQVLGSLPTALQAHRLFLQQPMEYKPYVHAVLVLVDDLPALSAIYGLIRATQDLSYTLIYMSLPTDAYSEEIQMALQLLWRLSVLNVVVVLRPPGGQLLMVSYFPFSAHHGCQVISANVVNRYQVANGRWVSQDYFQPKLKNFYGCLLTCATWEDMPYLVWRRDGSESFVGIEGALLQFMADNLNFSVGLYWMNKDEVLATFDESGKIFDEIFGRHADFSLGGFHFKPSAGSEIPYSQSTYYFMSHIMLVTNLQSAYSAYEKLAFPFGPVLWRAIGLVLFLACLLLMVVSRWLRGHKLPRNSYYELLVLTMGGNLQDRYLPRKISGQLVLLTWLFATLVLRSAYQSGMYQLLRQDTQRNPPQTISEVLAQHYTILLAEVNEARIMASLPELRPEQLVHLEGSELQSFPALAQQSGSSARMAILTPYEYFGYFRKVHPMSRRLHLVRERIYTQQLAFYVRRHSHLVGVLNKQIQHAHAHGFLEHWTRQYVSAVDETDESVARIASTSYSTLDGIDGDPKLPEVEEQLVATIRQNVLSMQELAALFWLILWANLGALVIFALEVILSKIQLRRRSLTFHPRSTWEFIDPDLVTVQLHMWSPLNYPPYIR
ncbi:uncharacterized protein LOC108117408 [Drosophila eugracilis]|uniref:uncharacterized protein LOC108117408 n=1 Tax=Drosophila eugracilis TaxID=29029 RepID=UPI001BDA7F00|nr:uncharacterized protein LOC108117408 [Drosophila eugracilis]